MFTDFNRMNSQNNVMGRTSFDESRVNRCADHLVEESWQFLVQNIHTLPSCLQEIFRNIETLLLNPPIELTTLREVGKEPMVYILKGVSKPCWIPEGKDQLLGDEIKSGMRDCFRIEHVTQINHEYGDNRKPLPLTMEAKYLIIGPFMLTRVSSVITSPSKGITADASKLQMIHHKSEHFAIFKIANRANVDFDKMKPNILGHMIHMLIPHTFVKVFNMTADEFDQARDIVFGVKKVSDSNNEDSCLEQTDRITSDAVESLIRLKRILMDMIPDSEKAIKFWENVLQLAKDETMKISGIFLFF